MKKIIKIDLSKWETQNDHAKKRGCSLPYISKLIRLNKIKFNSIPELKIVLVERFE